MISKRLVGGYNGGDPTRLPTSATNDDRGLVMFLLLVDVATSSTTKDVKFGLVKLKAIRGLQYCALSKR
jgi:hypothetical protein